MTKLARTNYRRTGNVIKSGWASMCCNASGIASVSTGLKSPRFGIALHKASTEARGTCAGVTGNYYTATGSTILVQWFSASGGRGDVLSDAVAGFNWLAFE